MLADQVGAVVVHAEGILVDNTTLDMGGNEESWNAGYCCGDALFHDIDDVGYLREVIARTVEAHPVDEQRIYVTGWSNGCMMAQRMALQASDLIAAVACTSGYLSIHEADGYTPVPVMEIHGFIDENQQYTNTVNWAIVDENRRNLESMQSGAVENMYDWAEYNDCEGSVPDRNEPGAVYTIQGFTNCADGTEVALITVHSGDNCTQRRLHSGFRLELFRQSRPLGRQSTRVGFLESFLKTTPVVGYGTVSERSNHINANRTSRRVLRALLCASLCFVKQDAEHRAHQRWHQQGEKHGEGLLNKERNHTKKSEHKSNTVGEGEGPSAIHFF